MIVRTRRTWNPVTDIQQFADLMDRAFGSAERGAALTLPLDVFEQDGQFIVRASVAGVKPDELNVEVENNILTISGEFKAESKSESAKVYFEENRYGSFTRSVRLPKNLNLEAITADFANGIVTVRIPQVPEVKPAAIKVAVKPADLALEASAPAETNPHID